MTPAEIVPNRLANQQITRTDCRSPKEIVATLMAMQAQEFAHAKWAIALRLPGSTESNIDKAFNDGEILRTHVLRPTWHFVAPADIRWLLKLSGPRVNAGNATMNKKFELDDKLLAKCTNILVKALEGGKQLTRVELQHALKNNKIAADGVRLVLILMKAELDAIICSGPRKGRQFTYALLEERVPAAKALTRQEALGEIVRRYFATRGPATLQDFVYWSHLTSKDAREGLEALPSQFQHEKVDGKKYIFAPRDITTKRTDARATFLMPDYDEYGMSYKDRSAIFQTRILPAERHPTFQHSLVIDGIVEGQWKRILKKNSVTIETAASSALSKSNEGKVVKAVERYLRYEV